MRKSDQNGSLQEQASSTDVVCGAYSSCCVAVINTTALAKKDHLRVITDGNWEEILEGEWMIEFFAPWCPACQQLQTVWDEFAEWGEDMGVNIAKVDVTEQPGLSGRFIITALPTIYHCKDGVFRRYQGARTKDDFLSFVDEKKWQEIEPVSSWFGPSSFITAITTSLSRLGSRCGVHTPSSPWQHFSLAWLGSDCVFPSRRFSSPNYYQKKQALKQARIMKQLEVEHEADGEEEDEEEEEEDYDEREREGFVEEGGARGAARAQDGGLSRGNGTKEGTRHWRGGGRHLEAQEGNCRCLQTARKSLELVQRSWRCRRRGRPATLTVFSLHLRGSTPDSPDRITYS
ncbi:hypothetical protein SKAU_G00334050 [Synaphobranchus kaupii]|uniref:Thioredoxin-related transmembrane protein 1 n=1 Tax=Synaphobranchus kaupii TaxID=118154 RepID=A0A9Q1IIV4_SYNKA|nr:hypothetical protein SKAU_G00334050 [Synaphobranchus kaupii]